MRASPRHRRCSASGSEPTSEDRIAALRAGGKAAIARAIAGVEAGLLEPSTTALLDDAWHHGAGHIVGLTGPPGVGKSTLVSALVRVMRIRDRSVAVVAVDPTSGRTGGSVLGDRARIDADPEDAGVFVRSMAAGDRLGGIARVTPAVVTLLRALFDVVIVETVGVGQSETDIELVADTVVLAAQPGSGDGLQFMKAGALEIPDMIIVTKADLGPLAERTYRDLEAAISGGTAPSGKGNVTTLLVSAQDGRGIDELVEAIEQRSGSKDMASRRRDQAVALVRLMIREQLGRQGLERLGGELESMLAGSGSPFGAWAEIMRTLDGRRSAGPTSIPELSA